MIKDFYNTLDRDRRYGLAWAVGLAVFSYFIFISHHLLGNHALRLPWLHESEQISNGRWIGPLLGHLHYDADVPVFMPTFGIVLGALAALAAVSGWQISRNRVENVIVFSIILIFPMNLAFFYYSFMTPLFFLANFFAAVAILVSGKIRIWRIVAGSFFVLLMLASYQAALSIFGILTFAWPISQLLQTREKPLGTELRHQAAIMGQRIAAAGLGGCAYVVSLKIFKVSSSQSLDFRNISDVLDRVRLIVVSSFEHLWITQPDLLEPLKLTLLAVLVAAILASVAYVWRSPVRAAIMLLLWLPMIVSTKAVFLISDPSGSIYEYRYNSGHAFLHAFSFAVLFYVAGQRGIAKAALLAVSGFVLLTMIQANLVRQSVLMRGQDHDLAIANRILTRIEQLEGFDATRTYDLIRIGRYSTFRYNLFKAGGWRIDRAGDGHMDFGEVTDRWVDEDVFRLLGARIRFQQKSSDPQYSAKYAEISKSPLLDGRDPWPAESSVFISGNRIIVLMETPAAASRDLTTTIAINDGDTVVARFERDQWRSVGGTLSNLRVQLDAIDLSAGQGGLSVEALTVRANDRFRLSFDGTILDQGSNGVPLSFAVGPVFLDKDGKVVGWWSSASGREAVELAEDDGSFSFSREAVAPPSATSAHIGFHGPYSPDSTPSDGRIRITGARLDRLTGDLE